MPTRLIRPHHPITRGLTPQRGLILLPLLALALTLGCTPDNDGDPSDGGAGGSGGGGGSGGMVPDGVPLDADAVATGYGRFICDFVRQCGGNNVGFNLVRQMVNAGGGDCVAFFARTYRNQIADDVELSELRYDEAAFNRCRDRALEACDLGDHIPDCEASLRGRRPIGDPCDDSTLCTPGLFCDYDALDEGECRNACADRRAAGEACDSNSQCAHEGDRSGYCLVAADAFEGTCTTLALVGGARLDQPCGLIADGMNLSRITCQAGHWCDAPDDDAPGTCRAIPSAGQPCADGDTPCEGGICISGTCRALQIVTAAGGGCDPVQLQVCSLLAGLICIDERCVASEGREGQPCSDGALGVPCQAGLYCSADDVCAPTRADGEPCNADESPDVCMSGACQFGPDSAEGTCGADPNVCR